MEPQRPPKGCNIATRCFPKSPVQKTLHHEAFCKSRNPTICGRGLTTVPAQDPMSILTMALIPFQLTIARTAGMFRGPKVTAVYFGSRPGASWWIPRIGIKSPDGKACANACRDRGPINYNYNRTFKQSSVLLQNYQDTPGFRRDPFRFFCSLLLSWTSGTKLHHQSLPALDSRPANTPENSHGT